jgi:hypothetical protein
MEPGSRQHGIHQVASGDQLADKTEDRHKQCWGRNRESCRQMNVDHHDRGILAYGMGEGDCCIAVRGLGEAKCPESNRICASAVGVGQSMPKLELHLETVSYRLSVASTKGNIPSCRAATDAILCRTGGADCMSLAVGVGIPCGTRKRLYPSPMRRTTRLRKESGKSRP